MFIEHLVSSLAMSYLNTLNEEDNLLNLYHTRPPTTFVISVVLSLAAYHSIIFGDLIPFPFRLQILLAS